ncbi:MAG: nitroreductase family protein [Bacillota bacterium]
MTATSYLENFPYREWHAAIGRRRSRRLYQARPVEPALLADLEALCRDFRPFPEARAVLVAAPAADVFRGAVGSYGKVKGAPAVIAFIGDTASPHVYEKVGYTGEGLVLEATRLGLGTCWVGGFFRPETAARLAGVRGSEWVVAVTPVGYAAGVWSVEEKVMTGFGRTHRRRPLAELVTGPPPGAWPPWAHAALEAARLAPSALNRQPWRFRVGEEGITVAVDNLRDSYGIPRRLDCGIAMLHLELGALAAGTRGAWEFLSPPLVARFVPRHAPAP